MVDSIDNVLLAKQGNISFGIDLVAGIFGGSAGVLVGHPLDTIKTRLQSQGPNPRYSGAWHCFRSIVRTEGLLGLYKGLLSPMVGVAVINSLLFGVYGSALRFVASDPLAPSLNNIFWAGSFSGLINSCISCPMELVKIRMQNQRESSKSKEAHYKSTWDCTRQIFKFHGFKGFYRGFACTMIRDTPSYGVYFASYEYFSRLALPPDADPTIPSAPLLLAGGLAGVICWLVTYPWDVIKTRLQSEGGIEKYGTMNNAFRVVAKSEGYKVFFTGMGATALRAFPTNAATFYVVVSIQNLLHQYF